MSTSQQQQPDSGQDSDESTQRVIECNHPECRRGGRPWTFQSGYCTREHWEQHIGRKAFSNVRTSHTRCFTCFTSLKEIELPKPDMAFVESGVGFTYNPEEDRVEVLRYGQEETCEAAIGYQHLRPEATIGEKNVRRKVVTGTVCGECGAANHRHHIALIADGHRTAALAAEHLHGLDDDDFSEFNPELLHRCYRETGDIERAAGKAIIERRD
jgi:hypothetical protein